MRAATRSKRLGSSRLALAALVMFACSGLVFAVLVQRAAEPSSSRVASLQLAPSPIAPSRYIGSNALGPVHVDSTGFNFDSPAMMCKADVAADVVVSSLSPAAWNTPDGAAPAMATTWQQAIKAGYGIYTPVAFSSVSALHSMSGLAPVATLPFYLYGGVVGPDSLGGDAPLIQPGSEYVIVGLPRYDVQLRSYSHSSLVVYQAFHVDAARNVVLQPQIVENGAVTQQAVVESLARLKADLVSC